MNFKVAFICFVTFFWSTCYSVEVEEKINLRFQLYVSNFFLIDFTPLLPAIDLALKYIQENSSVLTQYNLTYDEYVDSKV